MMLLAMIVFQDKIELPVFFFKSESGLFAKGAQTHEGFVLVFKQLMVHTCISDMRTETFK